MTRIFDSYIIVDWSAASKPTTGSDSIWIGALTPDARMNLKFASSNPDTRHKAKDQLIAAIERLLKRGDKILLGFDFPLGYPAGTANALKLDTTILPAWDALSAYLSSELRDKADNFNNRFALAARMNRVMSDGPFPFWGCPKKDVITTLSDRKPRDHAEGEPAEFRITEQAAKVRKLGRPQPVWKLGYVGAVGGQAFTGIPVVHALRSHFGDKLGVWPMETGWIGPQDTSPQILVSEVYPSIIPVTVTPGRTKDEAQVESLANWFADSDSAGRLAGKLARPDGITDAESHDILAEEGWILGI